MTTIYPEGGERQLIQVLTGLEVPAGGRPSDLGMVCQNVATAAAVSGTTTVASEKFFATVEEDANRTAKEIAKKIIQYYTRHGWLPR